MTFKHKLLAVSAAAALGAGIGTYGITAWSAENDKGFGPQGIPPTAATMMHGGPGMMGMGHDEATMAQLRVIHELIENHDRITRTVTNLPDGIRTVTESDDPQVAKYIKEHVASMVARVDARSDPNLPIESDALHAIIRDGDKVKTTVETTEKGSVVVQTSSDPTVVAALQKHAGEVSDLVAGGMAAVHTAMMNNGAGMMRGAMMGRGMMHGAPNERTAPRLP